MLTSGKTDNISEKCIGKSVSQESSKDLIKLINEIIDKLSATSRFDEIVSGKKNIIHIDNKRTEIADSMSQEESLLYEQYEKTSVQLSESTLDMSDNVISELYQKYTEQFPTFETKYKTKFGNDLEKEALLYLEKHPRTVKDVLKQYLESYMNQTLYDSMNSYIKTWESLSFSKNPSSDEWYDKLTKSADKFLNIISQCNIVSEADINSAKNKLKTCSKSSAEDLITNINDLINNIKTLTTTRAEYLLKFGFCKMPNPLDCINNSQVNDLNLLTLMKKVVDNLYVFYTSAKEPLILPNGNKYLPKIINDNAKGLINKYLRDSAKKFVENYNGDVANFEQNLTSYLNNFMMGCEYAVLKNDINNWKNFASNCNSGSDYYQFSNIKKEAKTILNLFLENNINVIIDDFQIKTDSDIDKLFEFFDIEDSSELISQVNTIVDTIVQWKTLYQKLVDGDYKKNEIKLITYSFNDIDTSLLYGVDVIRAYYEFKEVYTESNISEAAFNKRSEDIINLLDELKPQIRYISKSMCRAFKVKFDEEVFERKYSESKTFSQKEQISAEKNWLPGNVNLKVNPVELFKTFVSTFDKSYYAWVCSNIK